MARKLTGCLVTGSIVAAIAGACSASSNNPASSETGTGGAGNATGTGGAGGGFATPDASTGVLGITPMNPTVTVNPEQGSPETVDFDLTGAPSGTGVFWRVVNTKAGVIDANGVFTPSGNFAGDVEIQAVVEGVAVKATVTVVIRHREVGGAQSTPADIGPGGLYGVGGEGFGKPVSDAVIAALDGTPSADAALEFVYPYDDTVFPLGVLPPLLMWHSDGKTFEAVRIVLTAGSHYEYKGYFGRPDLLGSGSLARHPIPKDAWDTATASAAGGTLKAELVLLADGIAYGPITQTWNISLAPVTGTIYYQAYGTELARNYGTDFNGEPFGGATLSIGIGDLGPALVAGSDDPDGCRVCHSVSAYGDRMVVQHGDNYFRSSSIDLKNGNAETTPYDDGTVGWVGMYPDGSIGLANSANVTNINATNQGDTRLYDLTTGDVIASPGLNEFATRIALPAFSHDGERATFTLMEGPSTAAIGPANGQKLVGMTFDIATMSFSDPVLLWEAMDDGHRPAFPTFMPSSRAIVFQHKWDGPGDELFGTRFGGRGELLWVDMQTGQVAPLARTNGVGYLPTGPNGHQADQELNYEPSISPVASGGYAWMVFMSRRLYGNIGTMDPWESDPRDYDLRDNVTTKKLWMAAIDLDPEPGQDPSHPAFYIPGQELHGVNSRPFFALDPCVTDTGVCSSGVDCCSGFCRDGYCVPPVTNECALIDERCETASDCCDTSAKCLGGFCAEVIR